MAAPVNGPCAAWARADDITDCPSGVEPADVLAKVPAASDLLWRWSGEQFGGPCTVVLRPVPTVAYGISWPAVWASVVGDGLQACGCSDDRRTIRLPGPVITITAVTIDGEVLDPEAYRVDDWCLLVRQDGDVWPLQDETVLAGELGSWSVTFTFGEAPPASGVEAAVALAAEFAQACTDGCDCSLPDKAVRATRNGVEFELQPQDLLGPDGTIGIQAVDLFLNAVNPHKLSQGSHVRSPDIDPGRVQSWP